MSYLQPPDPIESCCECDGYGKVLIEIEDEEEQWVRCPHCKGDGIEHSEPDGDAIYEERAGK